MSHFFQMVTLGQYFLEILPGFCNIIAKLRKTTSKHNSYSQTHNLIEKKTLGPDKLQGHVLPTLHSIDSDSRRKE